MKLCHIADLHFRKESFTEISQSIRTIIEEHGRKPFDAILIAGDTWHGPVQNTADAMFPGFVSLIRDLAECAPIAMIYGTPSHDTEGSLEIFETLQVAHQVEILRPGIPYGLSNRGMIYDMRNEDLPEGDAPRALLFGIPEPNKKWLLANQGAIGKDEADKAIREAVRTLFLGLGGMRKEHDELPCVLLYHGQVSGAKSGTGFTVETGAGISVSRDDLAMVGADYIALGDIHEPQQIAGIPAFYPGSIYPLNWGETHKAGANIIEIRDEGPNEDGSRCIMAPVSRIEFSHPQRLHIYTTAPLDIAKQVAFHGAAGKLTWLEIEAARDASIDTEKILKELIVAGALPGSRVTLNILQTETVRAGEITEKKALRDKVQVWANNSSLTLPAGVIAKADELERDAISQGGIIQGAHIRIDRLILRGAKGTWKKSHKDEIDLDLEKLGPGVIAVASVNGSGKTTILENLHPWPRLWTRGDERTALKDHFRLKDSFRDLYFTDERTGFKYRAFISMKADTASGGTEYFLYRNSGAGFEPMPGINGRQEPYLAAVAEIFGTQEMYLRTAFVTQGPTTVAPDLSRATKGQRKALFAELAGIDYLESYKLNAKARWVDLDSQVSLLEARVNAAQGVDEEITDTLEEIEMQDHEATLNASMAESIKAKGLSLKSAIDEARLIVQAQQKKAEQRSRLLAEIKRLLADIDSDEDLVALFKEAAGRRGEAERQLAQIKKLETRLSELKDERAHIDDLNRIALIRNQEAERGYNSLRDSVRDHADKFRRELSRLERDIAVAKSRLSAPIADHCPTCGQILPEDMIEHLAAEHVALEDEIARLSGQMNSVQALMTEAEAELQNLQLPKCEILKVFEGVKELAEIQAQLSSLNETWARATITKADEATIRIEEAGKRTAERKARINCITGTELPELDFDPEQLPKATQSLHLLEDELEIARRQYTETMNLAAAAHASAESGRKRLASAQKRKDDRDRSAEEMLTLQGEASEWHLLEKACGSDGIQALELDALAPFIAAVANRLLSGAYGSRYQLEFRTTRIAGTGKKTKQVEDFEIFVLDTESGDEQEIATLSGGESVWIKKALYDAFGIVRSNNTGIRFQTVMMDEADGALDPDSRMQYLHMLEAAHIESGRYQTLIITHSPELQSMVDQVIDVTKLEPRKEQ